MKHHISLYHYLVAISFIIIIHSSLVIGIIFSKYYTVDEFGHVPAGLSHWKTGRFEAYRVNPPLQRLVAAFPVLFAHPVLDLRRLHAGLLHRSEWSLGFDFIEANRSRYMDLFRIARLPGILWSALAAIAIASWGRRLGGDWGGILSTSLWCFNPTVLAFSALVTPDVAAAATGVFASYLFWKRVDDLDWKADVVIGLALGIAELTKFTLLVFYPLWFMFGLIANARRFRSNASSIKSWIIHYLAISVVSVFVINLGYLFEGTGKALGDFEFVSTLFSGEEYQKVPGNRFRGTFLEDLPVLLPADFILGVDVQRRDFESGFPSYLAGRWSNQGWWYYYLYAMGVKEPHGTQLLVLTSLLSIAYLTLHGRSDRFAWFAAALGISIVAFVSTQIGINHHLRYVLPAYPFLFVATARLASKSLGLIKPASIAIAALLALSIVSTLRIHPHEQSYFNELAGGPERGDLHLVDSNIDWGQDLTYLKKWLDDHPEAKPIGLAYFNLGDPAYFGIDYVRAPQCPRALTKYSLEDAEQFGPLPGYYAVSVNYIRGSRSFAPARGQQTWLSLAQGESYTYFQYFTPIARAGYSIRIYHITREQADVVRKKIGLAPLRKSTGKPGRNY